ncbi:MAG: NAD(P)-dependent oxidoreductase [Propionibacteriaceae bacterium]
MRTVTLPSQELIDAVGTIAGLEISLWDLRTPPPCKDIDLCVLTYPMTADNRLALAWPSRIGVVQVLSAGYDHVLGAIPAGAVLSNGRGIHTTATAEDTLALILAAQRNLPTMFAFQQEKRWGTINPIPPGLADNQVAIAGYGDIGKAIAQRLRACEAIPTGFARTSRAGDEYVDEVRPIADLLTSPEQFDIIILVMPLSEQTRHIVDANFLNRCRDGALLVNVGRGGLIDTDALLVALEAGKIRAALDVTDPEPLPDNHPLWSAPGAIIFPHVGGHSQAQFSRMHAFLQDQLGRLARGDELLNIIKI